MFTLTVDNVIEGSVLTMYIITPCTCAAGGRVIGLSVCLSIQLQLKLQQ